MVSGDGFIYACLMAVLVRLRRWIAHFVRNDGDEVIERFRRNRGDPLKLQIRFGAVQIGE